MEEYVEEEDEYLQAVNAEEVQEQSALYEEQVQTMRSQWNALMLDFRKYYVFYKKNPENQEYQRAYENVKANLVKLSAQAFELNNELDTNIASMNESLLALDENISSEKDDNAELKRKIQYILSNTNAATERVDDYQKIYNQEYLRNWGLVLSIGVAIYASTLFYSGNKPSV